MRGFHGTWMKNEIKQEGIFFLWLDKSQYRTVSSNQYEIMLMNTPNQINQLPYSSKYLFAASIFAFHHFTQYTETLYSIQKIYQSLDFHSMWNSLFIVSFIKYWKFRWLFAWSFCFHHTLLSILTIIWNRWQQWLITVWWLHNAVALHVHVYVYLWLFHCLRRLLQQLVN